MNDFILPADYAARLDELPPERRALFELLAKEQAKDDQPRPGLERQIADLWESVLQVANISRHDNYFELGGDSIQAIEIVARAQKQDLPLTVNALFDYPTAAELANYLESGA